MTAQQHIKHKYCSKFITSYESTPFSTGDYGCYGGCYPNYESEDEYNGPKALAQYSIASQGNLFQKIAENTAMRLARIERETKDKWIKRPEEESGGTNSEQKGQDLEIYFMHPFYWRVYTPKLKMSLIYPYPDTTATTINNYRKGDIVACDLKEYLITDINDMDGGIVEYTEIIENTKKEVVTFKDFANLVKK